MLVEDLPQELESLREQLSFALFNIEPGSRESEHRELEQRLRELLHQHSPSVCIHTGQAPVYNKITVERLATNSFQREAIDLERPVAYWSNLPGTDELQKILEARGIPCGYSFYGGQHHCNHLLFSSLYFSEQNGFPYKSGFIHLPMLPEQVVSKHRDAPCMPLAVTRKALSLIISHVAKKALSNRP